MNHYLAFDLLAIPILLQFMSIHSLKGNYVVSAFLTSYIHLSKFSSAYFFDYVEVIELHWFAANRLFMTLTVPQHNNKIDDKF